MERIVGQTLQDYIREYGMPAGSLSTQLEQLVGESVKLGSQTGIQLDLRADNIVIKNGVPYLVDLGPLRDSGRIVFTHADALKMWKEQSRRYSPFVKTCTWQLVSLALSLGKLF